MCIRDRSIYNWTAKIEKTFVFLLLSFVFILFSYKNFSDRYFNPVRVKPAFPVQLILCTLFNKIIGNTESSHLGIVSVVGHEFDYCASKSSFKNSIFNRNYIGEICKNGMEYIFIKRSNKSHVVMSN